MGPMIRDGWVRVRMIDLKGGIMRDLDDGVTEAAGYTVAQAVED